METKSEENMKRNNIYWKSNTKLKNKKTIINNRDKILKKQSQIIYRRKNKQNTSKIIKQIINAMTKPVYKNSNYETIV